MAVAILRFPAAPARHQPATEPKPIPSFDRAHTAVLWRTIDIYRHRADHALKLAQKAREHGDLLLWRGLADEAVTYQAMADGLADQAHRGEVRS